MLGSGTETITITVFSSQSFTYSLGYRSDYWDQEFADSVNFIGDPVVANPDVVETAVQPDDEFLILATDGLW